MGKSLPLPCVRQIVERSGRLSRHLPATAARLDILVFGFDSVSRLTWMRNLPRSYEYLVDHLGATVLPGYSVVGDGTPQALLPILTGRTERELPEARRGFPGATTVDGHPWIWKELTRVGYVTQVPFHRFVTVSGIHCDWDGGTGSVFGRPFVKRFALCYHTAFIHQTKMVV